MCLLIKKEGIFTSLQGLGNFGRQRHGFNPRGAMDQAAVRILNTLLGNDQAENVLELHFPAGEIVFEEAAYFAIGPADFDARLDGVPISAWQAFPARPSQELRFKNRISGARCYLAVAGGLQAGGRDPDQDEDDPFASHFYDHRLSAGTRVLSSRRLTGVQVHSAVRVSPKIIPQYSRSPTVRIIPGGEFGSLSNASRDIFLSSVFEVRAESNRMGYRLNGPALFPEPPVEIVSAAVSFGTIQLLPDGQLVVLMADHQTSGGYPRLGNVISSDLPVLAQLSAGETVSFQVTDPFSAEHAAAAFDQDLRWLRTGVRLARSW